MQFLFLKPELDTIGETGFILHEMDGKTAGYICRKQPYCLKPQEADVIATSKSSLEVNKLKVLCLFGKSNNNGGNAKLAIR